jgi:regulatory protein
VALGLLSRRAYSAAEVAERLARRGFDGATIQKEVARLEGAGLIDDRALAEAVARDVARRGYGRTGVAASLRRRKVRPSESSVALGGFGDEREREALGAALKRAERRHGRWRELPEERRKVVRYLLARGFAVALIRDALSAAEGESGEQKQHLEPGDPPDLS